MADKMGARIRGRALPAGLEISIPRGVAPHVAPVIATVRCVEAITEQSRHDEAEGFEFGQTPLRSPVPLRGFGFGILLAADDAFDIGAEIGRASCRKECRSRAAPPHMM